MPEEGLETQDLKEQVDALRERAEGASEKAEAEERENRWLTWLSLSTAGLAALAAVASLHAGGLANEAIVAKSEAVLAQSEYADNWSEYQSRNIKAYLFETQAALLPDAEKKGALDHAAHEHAEADKLKPVAAALRAKVEAWNEDSAAKMERHEGFAKAVTLFQIAIAVAAIAALTRRKPMWWLSLLAGAAGIALVVLGFTAHGTERERTAEHDGGRPQSHPE